MSSRRREVGAVVRDPEGRASDLGGAHTQATGTSGRRLAAMDGRHGRNPPAANLKLSPRTLALPLSPPLASEREALDARLEEIEANSSRGSKLNCSSGSTASRLRWTRSVCRASSRQTSTSTTSTSWP